MKFEKSIVTACVFSIALGVIGTLGIQNLDNQKNDVNYIKYNIDFFNYDSNIYQSAKYYINDIPVQYFSIPQNQIEYSSNFFAPENFVLKIEFKSYAQPVVVTKFIQSDQLITDQSWCKEGLYTIAPLQVVIKDSDDISILVGEEEEFQCPG